MDETLGKKLAKAAGYTGRKTPRLIKFNKPFSMDSYWDSGSRDYYYWVSLTGGHVKAVPQNGTPFDQRKCVCDGIPEGYALVQLSIFRGNHETPRIYY
jgi:hypothetical protein